MISEILLKTRTRDSVNVYTRFGKGFVDLETHRYYEEIPEGREASEFGEMEICLRKDQWMTHMQSWK